MQLFLSDIRGRFTSGFDHDDKTFPVFTLCGRLRLILIPILRYVFEATLNNFHFFTRSSVLMRISFNYSTLRDRIVEGLTLITLLALPTLRVHAGRHLKVRA